MSYNGSGTFLINSAGQPVVANTVISATVFNALTSDLATGLSTAITKDGQTTITNNIPFGSNKITGLGSGTAAADAANLGQVQSTVAKLITVTGTDTITGSMSPQLTAYAAGQLFYFVANAANTGAVTLNIDSLGAKSITRDGSSALAAGDINSGEVVVVIYDGTRFQMINAANSFGNTTINGTLTVTGNAGFQANVSITSALSVGGVFAVTGAATFTANPTLSGGTANGVLYLNGSKVATSGSALVFDGTNLGLGTSSNKTTVVTGGATGMTIAAVGAPALAVWDTTDASYVSYLSQINESTYFGNNANGPLYFQTNAITRATLDSSGNLGIGTTSPQSGGLSVFAGTAVGATTPGVLTLGENSTTVQSGEVLGRIQFYSNDASTSMAGVVGKIDCLATGNFAGTAPTALTFHTNDGVAGTITERARITAAGELLVGLTSATSGGGVLQISNGITFPATQSASSNANTLDDYEEGTWTISITDGTTSKTATAYYTKIGRMVQVQGGVSNIEDPSAFTGNVYVSGLPFTSSNQGDFPISCFINYTDTATTWSANVSGNAQQIRFYRVGAINQDNVQLTGADCNFFTDIVIGGCYNV